VSKEQVIISISREYGSGGHEIAVDLGERLGVPCYDRSILRRVADEKGLNVENLKRFEETPHNPLMYRTVRGHNSSPNDAVAQMQFDVIRKMAETGESFVIVGRCSEEILKDMEGFTLITVFVTGDEDAKIDRVMKRNNLDEESARKRMLRMNRQRKKYHNRYVNHKWGDSRFYDLIINSSKLGVEGTVTVLEEYVEARVHEETSAAKEG